MHTHRAIVLRLALAILIWPALSAPPSRAAIESTSDAARVALPAPISAFTGGPNTVFTWLYRDDAPGERAILDIPGLLTVTVDAAGEVRATVSSAVDTPADLSLTISNAMPAGEWSLLTFSVEPSQGRLLLRVESDSLGPRDAALNLAQPWTPGPASGNLTLGAANALPAFRGFFGLVVVRDHAVTFADAGELFALKRHFGPYEHDNLDAGGSMTGTKGALWMVNHALFAQPYNHSGMSYNSAQLTSAPDRAARPSDFAVFDRAAVDRPESFRVVREVHAVDSFIYRSPFDVDPGAFVRPAPETNNPLPPNPVAAVSPRLRALAEGAPPDSGAPIRVVASANSRGVKVQDGMGNPANYAHGFTLARFEDVAGILLRPARASDVGPYFALRTSTGADFRIRRSPDVLPAEPTNYSRFWTGSLTPGAPGPGAGVLISLPNGFYSLRAQPEPGSRLTADARLLSRAYLFAYPGAAPADIFADVGTTQNDAGAQTYIETLDLDTAIDARTTTLSEATSSSSLLVPGDLQSGADPVTPGMAVVIATGPTRGDISIIASLQHFPDTNATRITLSHPLADTPAAGATLRFGPVRIETTQHTHEPTQGAHQWRGLEIRNAGDATNTSVVIFAFDAYNPDDGGYTIGPAGWSGRGYERQLNDSFPGATQRWMNAAQPDLWLAFIAHQFSATESLSAFTSTARAAAPSAEIAWIGCVEFEGTLHESWQQYILTNAKAEGVVGATVLDHPTLGSFEDLAADGAFVDGGHLTARGNTAIANAAIDLLRSAARVPGDANNDAVVDFADLNAVLSNFGASGPADGALTGDVNLDGVVDFADLNAALSNFGTSVFD